MREVGAIFGVQFGCDPEVFLSREVGKTRKRKSIVGSEAVVPPVNAYVARDGVQVELHPRPDTCRATLASRLSHCFQQLQRMVDNASKTKGMEGLKVDFSSVVKISKGDLMKLSPDSRQLGCMPSMNAYGRKFREKDGTKFLTRSAAGHIHVGTEMFRGSQLYKAVHPERAIKIADVLVGNQCVLIDRDPLAAERRKLYGRAGEYRLPQHGIEYRTPSNFWLQNYKLMSFVMAQTKLAMYVAQSGQRQEYLKRCRLSTTGIPNDEELLMSRVDLKAIEEAINTNNYDLAKQNWETMVKPFLSEVSNNFGINAYNLEYFEHFFEMVNEHGLGYWFKEDPLTHWANLPDGHGLGWESFLNGEVRYDLVKYKAPADVPVNDVAAGAYIITTGTTNTATVGGF